MLKKVAFLFHFKNMKSIDMYILHDASLVVCLSEYLYFYVKMVRFNRSPPSASRVIPCVNPGCVPDVFLRWFFA